MTHPALVSGRVAVITGAAQGIGLAAARRCASLGMKVCLADSDEAGLERAARELSAHTELRSVVVDVARLEDVQRLKQIAYDAFGEVALLMNNAAVGRGGGPFDGYENWRRLIDVNLWGVINGLHTFAPEMIAAGKPGAIVNVGSKQGITNPPGNAAYNASKAAVRSLTEQLAHTLRQTEGCQVSAHLLVPGFTYTGMGFADPSDQSKKPEGAWLPEQVIEVMESGMAAADFYLLCPDNEVTVDMDRRRMQWAADDVIQNRPALSRWHSDYEDAFKAFMRGE
jgi:NAD(P)-dependent dehydrogenase (short-subunit alcohol dehydrogenase family)